MRILLVGPALEDNLSLRYLSSSLLAAGHDVDLVRFDSAEDAPGVLAAAPACDAVGLSLSFQVRAGEFLRLARELKDIGCGLVLAGGHYASCAGDELLRNHPELDLLVLGEGEQTLVELAASRFDPAALPRIPGLLFRDGEGLRRSAPRPLIEELDSLPTPDRRGPVALYAGVPTAQLLGSRGCVGSCDYCCISSLYASLPGRRFRQRDPACVADEMAVLQQTRGIRQFIFHDDNFLLPSSERNHRRLDAFEAAWAARGLEGIGFVIKARPPDVDRSVFERLQGMGLLRVFLGVESGSDPGLQSIGRRQKAAEAERALAICSLLGISAQYTIMAFHPEADAASLRADLAFLRRHAENALNVCRTEIYAGSPLEARMRAAGRTRGSYLARDYRIADPAIELASRQAVRILRQRCWSMGGLMEQAIGLDHLGAVLQHYYGDRAARRLRRSINQWRLGVNEELIGLLDELVSACLQAGEQGSATFSERLERLAAKEERSRRVSLERGQALRAALDGYFPERVGLERREGLGLTLARRSRVERLAPHAAAVLLAFATPGCSACDDGGLTSGGATGGHIGVCEYAPMPLDPDYGPVPRRDGRTDADIVAAAAHNWQEAGTLHEGWNRRDERGWQAWVLLNRSRGELALVRRELWPAFASELEARIAQVDSDLDHAHMGAKIDYARQYQDGNYEGARRALQEMLTLFPAAKDDRRQYALQRLKKLDGMQTGKNGRR